jgi:hypothetical protein
MTAGIAGHDGGEAEGAAGFPASIRKCSSNRLSARVVIAQRACGERQAWRPREAAANSRSGRREPSAAKFSSVSEWRQPVRPVSETFWENLGATMAVTPPTLRWRPRRAPRLSSASANGLVLPRELGITPLTNAPPGGVSCCQWTSSSAVVAGAGGRSGAEFRRSFATRSGG